MAAVRTVVVLVWGKGGGDLVGVYFSFFIFSLLVDVIFFSFPFFSEHFYEVVVWQGDLGPKNSECASNT